MGQSDDDVRSQESGVRTVVTRLDSCTSIINAVTMNALPLLETTEGAKKTLSGEVGVWERPKRTELNPI